MVDKENAVGSGFMHISPPPKLAPSERKVQPAAPEEATLTLKKFADIPWVSFGDVPPGTSAVSSLHIVNPSKAEVHLTLERFPADKGFVVEGLTDDAIVIAPGTTSTLTLRWTPTVEGKINTKFDLKWKGKNKLQVKMLGTGVAPTMEQATVKGRGRGKGKGKGKPLSTRFQQPKLGPLPTPTDTGTSSKPQTGSKTKTQLQQSNCTGHVSKKQAKSVAKSSSLPVSGKTHDKSNTASKARNTNYGGSQAMDTQGRCFTKWLSHMLAPSHQFEPRKVGKHEAASLAMTQIEDEMQQLRLRERMFQLMITPEVTDCVSRLKAEVNAGRIATIRADVSLHDNVLVHNHCLECVMNYTAEWLRLGLEAVFNERCVRDDENFLSTFVKQKLMFDDDKAAASALTGEQCVLNQHTTLMMLTLVFVLDRAKSARMLDNGPSLFKSTGTIKSSSEMIHQFFDGVLSGGGDLLRQLRHINYSVQHTQSALEEYPFAVSNIATDLQDGVRLCKLAEILTNDSFLMNNVKCPANSTAVMKHNINIALEALQKTGCNVKLCAKPDDIIRGRQDRTLSLLWNVMMHWQILDMIDADALSAEVDRVKYWRRESVASRRSSILSDSGIVDTDVYMNSEKLGLLLLWCREVCAHYGVKVHNFTSSFSDGRVLCVILHHYHPELLLLEDISGRPEKQVPVIAAEFEDDSYAGNIESSGENFINFFIPLDSDNEEVPDVALEGKMSNFHLLQSRAKELGGIPNIITSRDMVTGAPDEKVVITYVTYLSSRLMDIRVQVDAARAISRHWKAHSARLKLRKSSAVLCIQQAARARFGFKPVIHDNEILAAAHQIQRMWRGFSTREQVLPVIRAQLVSVDLLQATFRAFMQRRAYKLILLAVTKLQSMRRGKMARDQFVQTTQTAQTLQRLYRDNRDRVQAASSNLQMQAAQATQKLEASIVIQAQFRACSQRHSYTEMRKAAIKVQAALRCSHARKAYGAASAAATTVQTAWKGRVARKMVATLKAVVRLQALWRGTLARQSMEQDRSAVVMIQAAYRARSARISFQAVSQIQSMAQHNEHVRSSCVTIQAALRGYRARKAFANVKQYRGDQLTASATTIQAQFRACSQRHSYTEMRKAAIKVQAALRCSHARKAYEAASAAATTVQTAQRRYAARKALQTLKAVVRFQALWRGFVARQTLEQFGIAATTIQAQFRACSQRHSYTEMRKAAIKVQAALRCSHARKAYEAASAAATTVQTAWKIYFVQKSQRQEQAPAEIQRQEQAPQHLDLAQHTEAATQIQRACRGWSGRKRASRQLRDIISVQSLYRGHVVRHNADEDVTAVRHHLQELSTKFNPRDTLEHRTEEALAIVSNTALLDRIIPAINTLDTVTRLSAACCKSVVDEDAVHIVLRLVRACNRSTSHMDLLKSALNVLYNLCKHRGTCRAVFAVSASVEIFAELMQLYRDKPAIYVHACTILRTMCKIDSQRKAIIAMKDIVNRIEGIHHILELKHKREAEHCAHVHNTDGDARAQESLKQLQAQLRSTAKLMDYLGVGAKSKARECRKLRL